jgi:hypothetical protein
MILWFIRQSASATITHPSLLRCRLTLTRRMLCSDLMVLGRVSASAPKGELGEDGVSVDPTDPDWRFRQKRRS